MGYWLRYFIGYRFADVIVCQTDAMKNSLAQHVPFLKNKMVVIPNLLNIQKIANDAALHDSTIEKYDPYVLAVGRFIPEKNFEQLIEAYAALPQKPYQLLILGDGNGRKNLESLIKKLGVSEKVFLPGYQNNPYPFMKKAKICVLNSTVEGFPNSLLQMLLLNEKCIATKCCDGLEAIPALSLIETNNLSALKNAMLKMIDGFSFSNEILVAKQNYLAQRSPAEYLNQVEKSLKKQ